MTAGKVGTHIAEARPIHVLDASCPSFPGDHRYYPSRRHTPSAFTLRVDALCYPAKAR